MLHLQMKMLAEEQMIDLFGITFKLRQCRKLIVQAEVGIFCMNSESHEEKSKPAHVPSGGIS